MALKIFSFECASKTDIGLKRANNEDAVLSFLVDSHEFIKAVLIVADGVGGSSKGEVASNHSVSVLSEFFSSSAKKYDDFCLQNKLDPYDISNNLKKIFSDINSEIYKLGTEDNSGMATTLTCCIITNNKLFYAHLGDTRIYLIRNKKSFQITEDDNFITEYLKKNPVGSIEKDKKIPRNQITQAIGMAKNVKIQVGYRDILPQDFIFLCSDGLYGMLDEKTITKTILTKSVNESVNLLISLANKKGGSDNISVSILQLKTPKTFLDRITSFINIIKDSNKLLYLAILPIILFIVFILIYIKEPESTNTSNTHYKQEETSSNKNDPFAPNINNIKRRKKKDIQENEVNNNIKVEPQKPYIYSKVEKNINNTNPIKKLSSPLKNTESLSSKQKNIESKINNNLQLNSKKEEDKREVVSTLNSRRNEEQNKENLNFSSQGLSTNEKTNKEDINKDGDK